MRPFLWDYSVPIFMSFQHNNAQCNTAQTISNDNSEFSVPQWSLPSPALNLLEHLWDVLEQEIFCAADNIP